MKPLLKWVGGKTKLIPVITKYMPHEFNHYVEPFTGGGAVFFNIETNKGLINDVNAELINFYTVVKNDPSTFYKQMGEYSNDEKTYYKVRSLDRQVGWKGKLDCIGRAVRFLYLNKNSFQAFLYLSLI